MFKKKILNYQIESKELHPLIKKITCESELLGLGSILMYYSPRELLSFQNIQSNTSHIQSDDAGPSQFKFIEHGAGTVMYYSKDLCLLHYSSEFSKSGLSRLRINLRFLDNTMRKILHKSFDCKTFEDLKSQWPTPLLHGYYGSNKSDSVFKHLPKRKKDSDRQIAAEVIDFDEKSLLIKAIKPIHKNDKLRAVDTKKRDFIWNIDKITDLQLNSIEKLEKNGLGLTPKIRTLITGSFIYFD